jgi:hypothetical protein
MGPHYGTGNQTMFDRIVVNIVNMSVKVILTADKDKPTLVDGVPNFVGGVQIR